MLQRDKLMENKNRASTVRQMKCRKKEFNIPWDFTMRNGRSVKDTGFEDF